MKYIIFRLTKMACVIVLLLPTIGPEQFALAQQSNSTEAWFVRIIAENTAENLIDRGTVLGEVPGGKDGYDSHDLPELEPFSDPYLTVVFNKDNWGQNNGAFNSDFRRSSVRNPSSPKEWRFTVRTDDPNREINLSWESEHKLDQMVVVDLATGEEIYPVIAGKIRDYSFNMNGETERDFIWKY